MLLCICRQPRKGANYCTEETMCRFIAKFTLPGKQTKIPTTCTLCWYLGTFFSLSNFVYLLVSQYLFLVVHFVGILVSWLYTLLVSWYLFLVIHTLLVSWYLFLVLHILLVSWYLFLVLHFVGILVPFPGCTLCWYLGILVVHFVGILLRFLVVNLAVNLRIVFLVQ